MIIQDTELECTEADGVVLDYWLGGSDETKEQWAKRIWDGCKEWDETNGKGYNKGDYSNHGMPSVYQHSAQELWKAKKDKRRVRLYQNMKSVIKKAADISDEEIMLIKDLPEYSTKEERHQTFLAEQSDLAAKDKLERNNKIDFYIRQGRSDADIILTHPELQGVLAEKRK